MGRAKESWGEFLERLRADAGTAAPFLLSFSGHLLENGYAIDTAKGLLWLATNFGRWLAIEGLEMAVVGQGCAERFLADRRSQGHMEKRAPADLKFFMAFLRAKGVIPPVPSAIPSLVDQVELSYSKYLTQERGLAPITVKTYLTIVRGFLAEHHKDGPLPFEMLCAREVQGFLTREARKYSRGRAKLLVTAIRSFLLWLYTCGKISTRMDNAIPGVPRWRQASLPRAIEPHEIDRLLQGRQRQTSVERRDYAILLLLARLGLRAHEVLVMTLDDIEWDVPAIVVHGKGGRQDRLPLPQDVGEAIAAYLRSGRPRCSTRVVFIRAKAPFRGLADSTSIGTIVRQALVLAGLHPPHMGAHLLRHSLACSMLDHGATLPEIGEILRHRSLATTGIYAKVDLKALTPLAQEWPLAGGAE